MNEINLTNVQYIASGGTFLLVATLAIRILLKLQLSSESIYERRSDRQVATIKDLEEREIRIRHEMELCHEERSALAQTIGTLKAEAAAQKIQIAALEAEMKLLKKSL
jgi:seryl-tRNA synthetase